MKFRGGLVTSFSLLLLAVLTGPVFATSSPLPSPALRIHWLGLPQIAADTNSTQFMKVWQLPETTSLVNQTLDKLSRWPVGGVTNAASQALRPLLDDLVASEFYLEANAPTNHQLSTFNCQLFLAIRLSAARATAWQTNLAAALASSTGFRPVITLNGWQFQPTNQFPLITFSRTADWTIIGIGPGSRDLPPGFAAGLPRRQTAPVTNDWLNVELDTAVVPPVQLSSFKFHLSESLSHVSLTFSGDHGEVLTRGTLTLSQPWKTELPAWDIPTNLIHSPLTSFTAMRGFSHWLGSLPAWQKNGLVPIPEQAYFWAQVQPNGPFVTYFSYPALKASNQLSQFTMQLVQNVNPWLVTNGQSSFQWDAALPGITWRDGFIIAPFIKVITLNDREFILGGLIPYIEGSFLSPMQTDILHAIYENPNSLYFHVEQTGDRIEDEFFITQAIRLTLGRPQLPAKAVATLWMKNIEPLLGFNTTIIIRRDPQTLNLIRKSTIGFTALELHLLADWLESPQFPHGLHTFLAPPENQ